MCFFFILVKDLDSQKVNISVDKEKAVYIEGIRQKYNKNYRDLPEFDMIFNEANDYYNNLKSLNKSSNEILEQAKQEALNGNFNRAEELAGHAKEIKTIEDSYDYFQFGILYEAILKYDSAELCFETALKLSPENSTYQLHLSNVYGAIGKYRDAILYIEKAIENGKRKGIPDLSKYYHSYANALIYLGRLDEAQNAISDAIFDLDRTNSKDVEEKSRYLSILAYIYSDKGDFKNSFKYCQQAIDLLKSKGDSPALSTVYHNYALSIWQKTNREFRDKLTKRNDQLNKYINDAKKLLKLSIEIQERTINDQNQLEYNLDLAYSFNLLSMLYYKDGFNARPVAFDSAIYYGMKSINHLIRLLPKCHPILGSAYSNLGMNYYGINDFKNANKFHDKAIETISCSGDTLHPYLASAYHNKAKVAFKTKNIALAEELIDKAITIYTIEAENGGDIFYLNDSKSFLKKILREKIKLQEKSK